VTDGRARSIFVTGGTGFIGRHLVRALSSGGWSRVTWLTRSASTDLSSASHPAWSCITGDLATPSSYQSALQDVDTVVHLAAATGSANDAELRRTNVEATAALVRACEEQGVRRILFVSSIAAKYPRLEDYAYGRTKVEAESVIRQSNLDYTILRPTIVLGPGSPIWKRLRTLATAPMIMVFGSGKIRVQPIDVRDVARGITLILARSRFAGEVIELGGPEVLTFESMLRRIRLATRGSGDRTPVVHLPVAPVRRALGMLGKVLGDRVPVSPGQLTPFLNDGVADPSDLANDLRPGMTSLRDLFVSLASER
jgi:NADH dehydrogenase